MNDTQVCYETPAFMNFQHSIDLTLLGTSVAASLLNILVIYCAQKLREKTGDSMHMFVISMTLGDLFLTAFSYPPELLVREFPALTSPSVCSIIHFSNWTGLAISGLSLTLLNFDKLIYFQWPLRYRQEMSKTRASKLCGGIWVVSMGFVIFLWLTDIILLKEDCSVTLAAGYNYFYHIYIFLFCILPVTSSLIVSIYLFRLLENRRLSTSALLEGQNVPTHKIKVKSLMFIFTTTFWTSLSLLPYRIFMVLRIYLIDWETMGCHDKVILAWAAWVLVYLLQTNPLINPIITAVVYAPYRKEILRLAMPFRQRLYSFSSAS